MRTLFLVAVALTIIVYPPPQIWAQSGPATKPVEALQSTKDVSVDVLPKGATIPAEPNGDADHDDPNRWVDIEIPDGVIDVPTTAREEVIRRGRMVQKLGTDSPDVADYIADALAPPADDAHKWYFTVVTSDSCPHCDHLISDIKRNPIFKAWVNVDEPEKSPLHYQVRRFADLTQSDWLKGVRQQIQRGGVPATVIQPPRNGAYGSNSTVVCILHGYDGNAERFTEKLSNAMKTYVAELHKKGEIRHVGASVSRPAKPTGIAAGQSVSAPPPFVVPDKPADPTQPQQDWPPVINPQPLTYDQLKVIVPDATAEFLLSCLTAKDTDASLVRLKWDVEKKKLDDQLPDVIDVEPTDWLGWISVFIKNGAIVVTFLMALAALVKVFTPPAVDKKIDDVMAFLQRWETPDEGAKK